MGNSLPHLGQSIENIEGASSIRQETIKQNNIAFNLLKNAKQNGIDTTNALKEYQQVQDNTSKEFSQITSERINLSQEIGNNTIVLQGEQTPITYAPPISVLEGLPKDKGNNIDDIIKLLDTSKTEEELKEELKPKEIEQIYILIQKKELDPSSCPVFFVKNGFIGFQNFVTFINKEYLNIKYTRVKEKLLKLKNNKGELIDETKIDELLNKNKCSPFDFKEKIFELGFDKEVIKDIFGDRVEMKDLQAKINLSKYKIYNEEIDTLFSLSEEKRKLYLQENFSDNEIIEINKNLKVLTNIAQIKKAGIYESVDMLLISNSAVNFNELINGKLTQNDIINELKKDEALYLQIFIDDDLILTPIPNNIDDIINNYQVIKAYLEEKENDGDITPIENKLLKLLQQYEIARKTELLRTVEIKEEIEFKSNNINKELKEKTNNEIDNNNYILNENNGNIVSISLDNGDEIILNQSEIKEVSNNPEALNNLINFYKTLDEANMLGFWNIRNDIFKVIGGIDFSSNDGDYLNQNEIKLFLNTILKSIKNDLEGETLPVMGMRFNEYIERIKVLNKSASGPGNIEDVNLRGDSYLLAIFKKKFVNENGTKNTFNNKTFRDSLGK